MNILFLAPRLPFPADTGGKIRTFNILKQMAQAHEVYLLCFSFEDSDGKYVEEFRNLGIHVTLVPMKEPGFWQKVQGVLFDEMPYSIAKYRSLAMRQAILRTLRTHVIDAIHVDHLHMAHYEECFGKIPAFLDEHNVEYRILERCAHVEKVFYKRLFYEGQAEKMRAFEARKCKLFQGIFSCSVDDQIVLEVLTHGNVPVHVIPNGVDTDYFNALSTPNTDNSLVFTGSMDWLPNDDAITYFCKEILPLIWKQKDSVRIYVVGKSPSAAVKSLASSDPRVIVTGRVDDVREYMQRASVFIVPLRIGGGTRLKILEAMAMQKAVISTTIGAEGIDHSHDNIVLADTPQAFAQAVCDVLDDPKRIISLGESGRELVCNQYDWYIVGDRLNAVYNEVAYASK